MPLTLHDALTPLLSGWRGVAMLCDVDVNQYVEDDDGWRALQLEEAAHRVSVPLSSGDGGTFLLPPDRARHLVAEIEHYNATVLDVGPAADITELYVEVAQHDWNEGPALDRSSEVAAFVSAHDDCYVYAEHRDRGAVTAIAGRALALAVGSAVLRGKADDVTGVEVVAPPDAFVTDLLGEDGRLAFEQAWLQIDGDRVVGTATRERYALPGPVPEGTVRFEYDRGTGEWS